MSYISRRGSTARVAYELENMAKVLVVEDDASLSARLREWLELEHHQAEIVGDGKDALNYLRTYKYDLIILDWHLPSLSGLEVCRHARSHGISTPILMLTGVSDIPDKATALDTGADDYVTKPFHFQELSARLRALLRRQTVQVANILKVGGLVLDPEGHEVTNNGQPVQLLPKEFALLEFLMRHPNQIFSSEALLDAVWLSESEASPNTVRTHMYTLRKKLSAGGNRSPIETVHGVGYKLEA
jgi:DNA-binding response OmpR family regulator